MRRVLIRLILIAVGCAARTAVASPHPAVVELFTSQGCSSCPPADAYLGELAERPDVLALSFHVDYWDNLGWRDPFGIAGATPRQRTYGSTLHLDSVFTPQLVIDGTTSYVGSDRRRIERHLSERGAARDDRSVVLLAMTGDSVEVSVPAQSNVAPSEVVLIAYRRSATSAVGRGENAGRSLVEYNIVRDLRTLGRYTGSALALHVDGKSLPADATDVAVLLQEVGQGAVLAAARQSLK